MTLRSYLRIFRERFTLLAAVTLACVAIAVGLTLLTTPTYQADAQVFVTSNGVGEVSSASDRQVAAVSQAVTFAQLIDTPDIVDAVKSDLQLSLSDEDIKGKLSATAPSQQTIVIISATDKNADTAAAIANSAAKAFVTVIQNLQKPTDSDKSTVRLFVTDRATAPGSPIAPTPTLNIALGFILGLLLGAALAVARDVLDNRIKNVDVLGALTDAPPMGVVIKDPDVDKAPVAARAEAGNMRAENFRQLRANLQFADVDRPPRVVAVTSSMPAEGKTMVAMNLAATLAEAGFTVCLVDADLRRPTVADTLGLVGAVGLTSVLSRQLPLSEALQSAGTNFSVLASGPTPPNPSEVLASSYVREVVRSLLDTHDYVVLDTAPLLPVADGSEVAALADGTLLVARHKVTTDAQVKRSMTALNGVSARLIGVVLNGVPSKRSGEYGYTYYGPAPRRREARPPSHRDQGNGRPADDSGAHGVREQIEERA